MNIRTLLYLAAAWFLFAAAGSIFLKSEDQMEVFRQTKTSNMVQAGNYLGTPDLTQVSGDQVIGMVPFALAGEFPLIVDGITINSTTNISTVNLSGVSGLMYTLSVTRDSSRNILTVTANKN